MAWNCKPTGGYTTSTPVLNYPDAEGTANVLQMYYILMDRGWTVNAICGLVTCIAFESGYNPWRWENNHLLNSYEVDTDQYPGSYGYGLVQWTPASYMNADYYAQWGSRPNKYINNPNSTGIAGYGPNFADVFGSFFDGYAQLIYLDDYGYVGQYYDSLNYYGHLEPTFAEFRVSTRPASDLCETWTQNFERAGGSYDPTRRAQRQALATELFNWLQYEIPLPPDVPTQTFPIWLLLKWRLDQMHSKIRRRRW